MTSYLYIWEGGGGGGATAAPSYAYLGQWLSAGVELEGHCPHDQDHGWHLLQLLQPAEPDEPRPHCAPPLPLPSCKQPARQSCCQSRGQQKRNFFRCEEDLGGVLQHVPTVIMPALTTICTNVELLLMKLAWVLFAEDYDNCQGNHAQKTQLNLQALRTAGI